MEPMKLVIRLLLDHCLWTGNNGRVRAWLCCEHTRDPLEWSFSCVLPTCCFPLEVNLGLFFAGPSSWPDSTPLMIGFSVCGSTRIQLERKFKLAKEKKKRKPRKKTDSVRRCTQNSNSNRSNCNCNCNNR